MVPDGQPGELILRAQCPWSITPGYWRDAPSTAAAWRNGWFHTGDMFRRNADGDYFFLDRKKDAIRRRGENISSYEVELEILAHPSVAEAAVVAVPSAHGEDDVMAVVVLKPAAQLPAEELMEFLLPRMGRFMLPSYIRFVHALTKTPTLRVQKNLLRAQGVTPDTWSRAGAGQ
jgi:crotonobetaine/carnitine-CoA ligase